MPEPTDRPVARPHGFTPATARAAAQQRWYRHATLRLVTLGPCAQCGGTVHGWRRVDGTIVPVPPARCAGCGGKRET